MFTSITFTMNDHAISIVRKLKLKLLRFNYVAIIRHMRNWLKYFQRASMTCPAHSQCFTRFLKYAKLPLGDNDRPSSGGLHTRDGRCMT